MFEVFRNLAKGVKMTNKNIQWWKIAVCVLGVLVIAGAVTYTLMTRTSASSTAPATSSPTTPATSSPTPSATATNAPASDGTGEMNWIKGLNSKWQTNDFIFVIFPGDDDLTGKADQAVKTSLEKIRQAGGAVDTVTLSSTDLEFKVTIDRLAIQKLPAVLVFAVTGQGSIVKGDITETKLLEAYLALQKSTCAPGSGCCGGK
jgi:hypothetical protein